MIFPVILVSLLTIFCQVGAARVTFYEDNFHSKLLYQHDVTNGDCVPLPSQLQDAAGSLITENCLLIFTDASCVGTSIKVDPIGQNGRYNLYDVKHSSDEHFGRRVKSFKICNKFEGGNEVNVDFYTSSSSLVPAFSYKDMCECINIPVMGANFSPLLKINNHHNCVKLYANENCGGTSYEFQGGVSRRSQDLATVSSRFNSISPCARQAIETTASDISMAATTKFINNGGATVSQEYAASKQIKETHETHRVDTASKSFSISFGYGITAEAEFGIPFVGKTKITTSVTNAYNWNKETSTETGSRFVSEETVNYSVGQKIEIPPCNMYEEITGTTRDGKQVGADTLINLLGQIEYVDTKDNFTIIGKGYGSLKSTFGLQAVIAGEGQPIEGCKYIPSNKTLL